jgi:glycosyltransferase involved in cell wall biosynthesis
LPEPTVTVVSAVRNADAYVGELLASLEAQTLSRDRFDAVVVDDRSTDRTRAILDAWEAEAPDRRRVLSAEGRGPAAARNLGFRAARGEWIAFTDGDVVPDARWLEELLDAGAHAQAVEGRVVAWPGAEIRGNSHSVSNEAGGLYVTANMAYRRSVLERVGGFDERFEAPFLEDSDLAFRVLDLGVEIPFAPEAFVHHRVIPTGPLRTLRAARKLSWLPLLAAKHPARYAAEIRPLFPRVTRPDAHVLAGLAGLPLLALPGAARVGGVLAAANALRVIVRDPRLRVPPRDIPAQTALVLALPVAKATWRLVGHARFRSVR